MTTETQTQDRPARQCYICNGEKTVQVAQWDEDNEVYYEPATCPRCAGEGKLVRPPFIDDVIDRPQVFKPEPACICYYPDDGPMGNPICPAR